MQIYVSMPSFNMSESKGWHRTRPQLDAFCLWICGFGCQPVRVHSWLLVVCVCMCVFKAVFAFHGCCCSLIKRRSTKGEMR